VFGRVIFPTDDLKLTLWFGCRSFSPMNLWLAPWKNGARGRNWKAVRHSTWSTMHFIRWHAGCGFPEIEVALIKINRGKFI
jgi:hypothetical protein